MSPFFYSLLVVGVALEACILWRLVSIGLWRRFPYFFFNVSYMLLGTFVFWSLIETLGFSPAVHSSLYRSLYYGADIISIGLRFLVVWEVFRHTFRRGTSLDRTVSKGFAVAALGLVVFAVGSTWSYVAYTKFHAVYPALDRSFGFAQAVMILGMLIAAGYYELPLGRNIWGIAIGFGAYASLLTANNALIDLRHSFLPYWRIVSPLSPLVMLGMWTWAVWVDAPNPSVDVDIAGSSGSDFLRWSEDWNRTVASVRRVMNP